MYEAYLKRKFKRHQVLVLDGATKDRRSLMDMAEDPTRDTIVICQAAMGAAFELPSFRCTIFASMSYSYVDFFQALGRTLRANNLQKNLYVYLIAGGMDEAVLKSVKDKKDFNEMEYIMNV